MPVSFESSIIEVPSLMYSQPRRWLARTKQNFFTLSPEEERMLNAPIVETRVRRLPPGTVLDLNSPPINPPRGSKPSETPELS